jgi:hypothetical protein
MEDDYIRFESNGSTIPLSDLLPTTGHERIFQTYNLERSPDNDYVTLSLVVGSHEYRLEMHTDHHLDIIQRYNLHKINTFVLDNVIAYSDSISRFMINIRDTVKELSA